MIAIAMMMAAAAVPAGEEVTIAGPQGPLAGTYQASDKIGGPVVVIIPGSGPTDRDGNNPMGLKGQSYKLLAEALAARGVFSVRIDKRGMFGSAKAIPDANAATIEGYAADARGWAQFAAKRAGAKCAWLVGHSEGGLVALQAAQNPTGICGVILVSAAGRPIIQVMRAQFKANAANAPILPAALAMLDSVEAGKTVDPATLPSPLPMIFPVAVQKYLIELAKFDPAKLAANVRLPMTIIQGDNDLQVSVDDDAKPLAAAQPKAKLVVLPGVNHVLKVVPAGDRAANAASYGDATLPIAPSVVDAVAAAVGGRGAR
ncbi:MAG: alpha/beta fold hydrolase [Sphingomonas sp.]|uniref:alpha/beta hydrolase n=1 Tax=Sphingomonas sp. TaxID=28214 RepID=UPI001227EA16|nr:alpha/beta fold hydrolase [Sphingomonas sp.]THD35562.1 MAG: alpha/beta fold hydrolase [Sphingomonas sp.]